MLKRTVTIGAFLFIAAATALMTPDTSQAQRYFGGNYVVHYPYYQPFYGYYRPYYGYQRNARPYYGYQRYYRPYYGGYYDYGYPGYYGTDPRYGYFDNYFLWR